MKTKEIRERLMGAVDTVSQRDRIFTVRKGFFYSHGKTSDDLVAKVRTAFPDAEIVDSGEVWKSFRGGASVTQSSHWYVKFKEKESA